MNCRGDRQGADSGNAGEQRTERNRPSPDGVASPPFPLAGTQGQGGAASDTVGCPRSPSPTARSEEHTSELQSLMRISYAVFCLKKKKTYIGNHLHPHT